MLAISLKILSKYLALFPFSEYTFSISLFVFSSPFWPVVTQPGQCRLGPGDVSGQETLTMGGRLH